ncbi:MAG: hypothetical protein Q9217_000734 [Psora testacea]
MDLLRTFTRSASDSRTSDKRPAEPSSPSPYSLSPSSPSTTPPHQPLRLPLLTNDTLPPDPAALEAKLNEGMAQLQRLADRVESVNEWIETDDITLARLMANLQHQFEKENTEKTKNHSSESHSDPKRKSNITSVRFSSCDAWKSGGSESTAEVMVKENSRTKELRERIKGMKKWRRELERSVVWQREECWWIQEKMGVKRSDSGIGRLKGDEGWSVGGKTWEKGSGRVPTQAEWELMFGYERPVWDGDGTRPSRNDQFELL